MIGAIRVNPGPAEPGYANWSGSQLFVIEYVN